MQSSKNWCCCCCLVLLDTIDRHEQCVVNLLRFVHFCMLLGFVVVDNDGGHGGVAVAAAGELARALRLLRPVGAQHGAQHQPRADELRGEHAAPHPPEVQPRGPERQRQRHRHPDAVERRHVDPRRPLRPRAAAQHATPGRLRAVPQLGGAQQRQRRRRQPQDGVLRREHPRPRRPHGHREPERHDPERRAEADADARHEARPLRPPGAELVADAGGHGAAERVREDVYQRGGLYQHPHGRHRRLGVGEHAAEEHHDLVPPPFQADRHAAVHGQPHQAPPLPDAAVVVLLAGGRRGGGGARLRPAAVHSREAHVRREEQEAVEVGADRAERDAADAEAEAVDEDDVDGHVEQQRGGGGVGERERDGLRAEVDADGVEEALHGEVGEGAEDVGVRRGGDVRVLAGGDEDAVHGHPERADGHGRRQEQHDGAPERGAEQVSPPRAERLAANRVHPAGEAGEDGVAGDVGEAERERAAGERELAEAAEEDHGHQGAQVQQDPGADHRPGEAEDGRHLAKNAGGGAGQPRAIMQLGIARRRRRHDKQLLVALRRLIAVATRHCCCCCAARLECSFV
ncbi:Os09g0524001 [Oryza sativa Japonica Group]|uniref:Os09g0524001 protein n=1 Tax=Oryza sativa subsp. japonica TaxID=39947 RepID=A0A0P0XQ05_ORYSJ|nr:hypothetical protein EE612_049035 [Oryza sativa]BAT09033.1 Os09g0524001 [Oryza sativa Japonica Group]